MLNLRAPGLKFVMLATVQFRDRPGPLGFWRSDFVCLLRFDGQSEAYHGDVRVFFLGRETALAGQRLPVVIAFLHPDLWRQHCRTGAEFEILDGLHPLARGVVEFLAIRAPGSPPLA